MTVKELKTELEKYPEDFVVIRKIPGDYEDYDEIYELKNCNYTRFRGRHVNYSVTSNAVILK